MAKKGKLIGGRRMSYSEALRILGFKTSPKPDELRKRYRKLAKKYHPDISKELTTIERFKELSIATKIIREKKAPKKYSHKILGPYYNLIIKNLPSRPTAVSVDEAYAKIVSTPRFRQSISESEKLNIARKLVERTLEERAYFASKQRIRVRKALRRVLLPPDEREILALQEKARTLMVKHTIQRLIGRIKHMTRVAIRTKGKFRIPILIKSKRPYVKWIAITASIIVAIAGGKYLYDRTRKAYRIKKISGLLTNQTR